MFKVNHILRRRRVIDGWLYFAGGYPKFHAIPHFVRWGTCLSLFWLDTELVFDWGAAL